jgi:predicted TIM-barrel fold metal-dependent hydrolase
MIIDFSAHHIPDAIIARVGKTKFGQSREFIYSSENSNPEIRLGYAFFGPDRMVFGTDYPFGLEKGEGFIRENLASVKRINIAEDDKKKILGENAKKLLKIT